MIGKTDDRASPNHRDLGLEEALEGTIVVCGGDLSQRVILSNGFEGYLPLLNHVWVTTMYG